MLFRSYHALGKRYLYRVWNEPSRNPFWEGRAAHIRRPLDESRLDKAAAQFAGTHDFAAFCAAGSSVTDTVRTVSRSGVFREGGLVTFAVEADGFLYHMVRIMAGTLLDMAGGRVPYDAIPAILEAKRRGAAGATAPARGLILDRVFYPDDI